MKDIKKALKQLPATKWANQLGSNSKLTYNFTTREYSAGGHTGSKEYFIDLINTIVHS